jgi:hypothetical protein
MAQEIRYNLILERMKAILRALQHRGSVIDEVEWAFGDRYGDCISGCADCAFEAVFSEYSFDSGRHFGFDRLVHECHV